jgi:acyl-coenzyme A thioesterase PaaI-like protein
LRRKVVRKQPNSKMCLVCGLKNDAGLKASFYETESNEVVGLFTPCASHQGYPGRLHGGLTAAILDEAIGRAVQAGRNDEVWSVTVDLRVRFRKPIPLDVELRVVARVTREGNRYFEGVGELVLPGGEVAATGEGKYVKLGLDKIGDFDYQANEWRIVPGKDDPGEIDA